MTSRSMERAAKTRSAQFSNRYRRIGHAFFFVAMGILFVVAVVLGVGAAVSGLQPTYTGVFTQHGCEYDARDGCEPVGTWVSDNGSMVKRNVQLDGSVDKSGKAVAVYTPTGFNNDAENNIVHVRGWSGARYWLPWMFAVLIAGLAYLQLRRWRRQAAARTQ